MAEWTHTICERCWFDRQPDRPLFPVQVRREDNDRELDRCCFCGGIKITRIYCRQDPKSPELTCGGDHPEMDDEDE